MKFPSAAARDLAIAAVLANTLHGQPTVLNWDQIKTRFLTQNPSVLAGRLSIEEARANEITAGLRPNPQFNLSQDGFQLTPSSDTWRPLTGVVITPGVSVLLERQNKRERRVDSARLATSGAGSDQQDFQRTLLFAVRTTFLNTLQAKALVGLTQANLQTYDLAIEANRSRFQAGDISELDFQRVEVQRVQFESDLANARVNLRTAKIQLLALLNDRTPVDDFDVAADFEYKEPTILLPELRQMAVGNRPDLRSAETAIGKARADNRLAVANGTADPVVAAWYARNPSFNNPFDANTLGASVSIPIRIFDKNQGEKARTALEITRTERLRDALLAGIYRDVDSAYAAVESVSTLVRSYRDKYLRESGDIRDKVSFSYSHGNATVLEFLDAQKSYRDTQVAYIGLVGSYWSALAQLSLAVGQEVNP
ncbi:MAG: TolC family protein [Acidobacteria bacterium]|nr:MAG: TolC family protein [Acidobacteriota bacterium]